MDRLDVLQRVELAVEVLLGHLRRERPEDEDAGDARVGVQLSDERERVRLLDVAGELLADVAAAELLGDPAHAALVRLRRVVVADEDGGEAGRHPVPSQLGDGCLDLEPQLVGQPAAVDDGGAHSAPAACPAALSALRTNSRARSTRSSPSTVERLISTRLPATRAAEAARMAAAAASPRRFGFPRTAISAASSATDAAHSAIASGTSAARDRVSPISVSLTSGSSSSGMRRAVSTFS